MQFVASDEFLRAFKKLNTKQKKDARKALLLLGAEPMPKSLRFRRFQGRENTWIANINKGDRIILIEIEPDLYDLVDIGPHDATYRKWNRRK